VECENCIEFSKNYNYNIFYKYNTQGKEGINMNRIMGLFYCMKCNTVQPEKKAAYIYKTAFKALPNGEEYHIGNCKESCESVILTTGSEPNKTNFCSDVL
jgi:hypothetical protein